MIWKYLGFSRDIFFVEPLRPNEEDVKLFIGRDKEITKYLVDTLSGSRALKIVTGEVGVGKTTFVNACQYFSYINKAPISMRFELPRILPCFEKIQIRESDNLDDFFQQTITAVCQSIAFHCNLTNQPPPKDVKEMLSFFLDLVISSGGGGYNIGLDIVGTGAQFGKSGKTEALNVLRNARFHLKRLVDLVRSDLKFDGIFVIVNNLDILPKSGLISFLNIARDELFDIGGIYWTLIGRKGIGSIIESEVDRVADYLSGTESYIEPLSFEKTREIIEVRVKFFRKDSQVECPLSYDAIRTFHYMSLKETRETLKICGEIVKRVLMINPSEKVISDDTAIRAFSQYAHDRAKDLDLSQSQVSILKAVYEGTTCRPKDFRLFGYKTPQAFIAALKGLVGKRLLSVEEKGRARIYRMTGMTKVAAITGALGEDIKGVALKNMSESLRIDAPEDDRFSSAQLELELEDQNNLDNGDLAESE